MKIRIGDARPGRSGGSHFLFLPGILALATFAAGCHAGSGIEVSGFDLKGVHAFKASDLKQVLATRQSGRFPWSPRHYFDRAQFEADLLRIHAYYADHGYPAQRLSGVHVDISSDRTSVHLGLDVDEGAPTVVETVGFEGFEALPEAAARRLHAAPLTAGTPRDRDKVRATRDMAARLLRDNGRPLAYVDASERPGAAPDSVIVTFRADPGPAMRFGDVSIDGLKQVDAAVVRRQLAFAPDQEYRESQVLATQHRLSSIELFDLANITPRLEEAADNRVPVRVTIAEGKPRRLKLGIGYGTEERARGTINWEHLNFLGSAQRVELDANASFLDQGVNLSFVEPRFGRPGWSLNVSGEARNTRQLTYDSQNYGGRVMAIYRTERGTDGTREPVRYQVQTGYVHDYLRYGIQADSLSDLSLREERIALGLDPDTGRGAGTLAALDFDIQRAAVDNAVEPHRGTIASLHLEHAAPWLLGSYRFDEVVLEGRGFVPVGPVVVATRAKFGSIAAGDPSTVPFSKRYFLGGAASLRGWGRFQVGPLGDQGLPIGGRTLVDLSSEARFSLGAKLGAVFFVDAGNVGSSDWSVNTLRLRVDVGPGLRYRTPIGALRADLGFQLTPISGLVVNGLPESRRWRLHLAIGEAF